MLADLTGQSIPSGPKSLKVVGISNSKLLQQDATIVDLYL